MTEKSDTHKPLLLAPMEGLLDFVLRDVLTRVGGVDRCVSEFIRVSGNLLSDRTFVRYIPELNNGGRTLAGVPVSGMTTPWITLPPGCAVPAWPFGLAWPGA